MNIAHQNYIEYLSLGDEFKQKAETAYENNNYTRAVKYYYNASLAYEMAKEIAKEELDVCYRITAGDKEHYCQEKLDELKRFRGISSNEVIR